MFEISRPSASLGEGGEGLVEGTVTTFRGRMGSEEPPAVAGLPCQSRSGGNDGGGEKRAGGRTKRRFSDEQVRSLEGFFEAHTRVEPRRKAQLAGELGLHPRQVSVWFQNRRARWKSKQLEVDYGALRAEYDALLSSFESVQREKQSLAAQLEKLAELLEKPPEEDEKRKPSWLLIPEGKDVQLPACSDEEKLIPNTEEPDQMCIGEPIGVTTAADRRCCFDTGGGFPDNSCGSSSDWWEFWPLNESEPAIRLLEGGTHGEAAAGDV